MARKIIEENGCLLGLDQAEERAVSDSHEAMTREHRIKRRRIGMKRLPHVCYPIPMAIGSGANGQRRRRNSPAPQFCPKAGDQRSRTKDTRTEEHTSALQSLMRITNAVFCLKTINENNELYSP